MVFTSPDGQRTYESNDMQCLPLTARPYPCVYVAPDYSAVVLLEMRTWEGASARFLSLEEFRGLGRIYPSAALHAAIQACPAEKP